MVPHCKISKFLTYSDITSKIALPIEIVEPMIPIMNGKNFVDLKVVDSRDQKWKFRYYTRPNRNRKAPVFTIGWLQFVRAKRLQVGDEFTFSGHQVRATDGEWEMQYMIQVTRPGFVTFQGQPIIYLDVDYFLPD